MNNSPTTPWPAEFPTAQRKISWGVPSDDPNKDLPTGNPFTNTATPAANAPAGDLGGIFDAPSPASTSNTDLGSVFDTPTPVAEPETATTAQRGDDLTNLFGAATPTQTSPAETAPTDNQLDELFKDAPPNSNTAKPDTKKPKVKESEKSQASNVAAQLATIKANQTNQPHLAPDQRLFHEDPRYTNAEQYYEYVDALLGFGNKEEVQRVVRQMVLTRDRALDQKQRTEYGDIMRPYFREANIPLFDEADVTTLLDIAYDEIIGTGPLGPLWRDDAITEILVSGPDSVTVERDGKLYLTPVKFRNLEHLESIARTMAQRSGDDRTPSSTNPLPTIQLPGARVQFVWHPIAIDGVEIAIRKFQPLLGMSNLLQFGALTEDMYKFLAMCVNVRATILISGGTGAGKTTFINALSQSIPDTERVVTIEDAQELKLMNKFITSMVTKESASADDQYLFGQDALLKAALRLRPDRIIVGEIRDRAGCAVMLEAANTGHDGTMTTLHATSAQRAVNRMASLLQQHVNMPLELARGEVCSAIDVVVQVVRTRGKRFVSEIAILDADSPTGVTPIFTGHYNQATDKVEFKRVGQIGADTGLALQMSNAGVDENTA